MQGVDLYMPWSHLLPDYARSRSWYGQNLVRLAGALERRGQRSDGPLEVMDIGANIGDSAAQIMTATNARVLCVEGDPYWAAYLARNLADQPNAVIEEALLVAAHEVATSLAPVRAHGTTQFALCEDTVGRLRTVSAADLRRAHPEFSHLRLVKSDTDGFDPVIVPDVAQAWSDVAPVLFFEFDPVLARAVHHRDPNDVWESLAALGYSRLCVWDNTGDPLGQLPIDRAAAEASRLTPRPIHLGYDFWDVAACRGDDTAALAAFDDLVPEEYSALGVWRGRE